MIKTSDKKTCGNCKWWDSAKKYCNNRDRGTGYTKEDDYSSFWEER
ncbi:MAG: hypothetical protein KKA79_09780 [Nanoarchaeota archaeon]|nr:hypothetical protein [Nanoarchaeota archaeon]